MICGGTCQAITRSINIDEKSCEVRKEIFEEIRSLIDNGYKEVENVLALIIKNIIAIILLAIT